METKSNLSGSDNRLKSDMASKPQTEQKHPDEWEQDLSPNHMAGQNIGERSGTFEQGLPTAYDVKEVHRTLHDWFTDDELKQIPIMPEGSRLEEGATYLDLADPVPTEITAHGVMEAGKDHRYVAKTEVDYELWNRLRGITDPERTRPVAKDEGHELPVIS